MNMPGPRNVEESWSGGGEAWAQFSPECCVLLRSFYTLFVQKESKRTTFALCKRTQQSFSFFWPDSITNMHSWAQQKLSPLNPLNILLSINGPLLSLGFNRLND